ncbi:MAG TPA: TIM barrel protein [Gemmatimonadaceae bacterium]|nr:TIM barrel protein [Gemmatimonadaceae bacterium]
MPGAISRRSALGALAGAAATLAISDTASASTPLPRERGSVPLPPGRLNQSVCRWCYDGIPLERLGREAKAMGLRSVELLGEAEWPVIRSLGLTCAMANGPSTITLGWNRPSEHDRLVAESERLLPLVAAEGFPNMIVFSGNRAGMSDGEGLENCARGLARIVHTAERTGVTVCMELLNSKVDHKDYMCDHTPWGVELVKRVASPRFRLLYDIYHMQIMEGDVIRTIRDHHASIAHYHTGGVPGRAEIDGSQELNYPAIMRAIAETGYTGWVGQEFVPRRDPLTSLREGVAICTV